MWPLPGELMGEVPHCTLQTEGLQTMGHGTSYEVSGKSTLGLDETV